MTSPSEIKHDGIVMSIDSGSVTIVLSPALSCAGCAAARSCNPSGSDKKIVIIEGSFKVVPGDRVVVVMKQSLGYSALFLGYVLPLICVVAALITFQLISFNELISGLLAITVLILYYIILFAFRKMIGKKFSFTLKPITTDEFYSPSDNNMS